MPPKAADPSAWLAILGAFVLVGAGLISNRSGTINTRPASDNVTQADLDPTRVHARLWQDPIAVGWDRLRNTESKTANDKIDATLWKQYKQAELTLLTQLGLEDIIQAYAFQNSNYSKLAVQKESTQDAPFQVTKESYKTYLQLLKSEEILKTLRDKNLPWSGSESALEKFGFPPEFDDKKLKKDREEAEPKTAKELQKDRFAQIWANAEASIPPPNAGNPTSNPSSIATPGQTSATPDALAQANKLLDEDEGGSDKLKSLVENAFPNDPATKDSLIKIAKEENKDIKDALRQAATEAWYRELKKDSKGQVLATEPEAILSKLTPSAKSILPIVVPGDDYPETREDRLRSRYAVNAALYSLGYSAKNANTLDYIPIPTDRATGKPIEWETKEIGTNSGNTKHSYPEARWIPVTYEIFTRVKNPQEAPSEKNPPPPTEAIASKRLPAEDQTIVIWVDSRLCDDGKNPPNFNNIPRITKAIASTIDPFANPAKELKILSLLGSEIFREPLPKPESDTFLSIIAPRSTSPGGMLSLPTAEGQITVDRPIPSDDFVLTSLSNELDRRIPWKQQPQPGEPKEEVWLIYERDSFYSQSMRKTFKRIFSENHPNVEIRDITYLKGIDGYLPDTSSSGTRPSKQVSNMVDALSAILTPTTPQQTLFTQRQHDYLQRQIAMHLNPAAPFDDATAAETPPGKVRAIGILGSDIFDKLTVLQIFRDEFKNSVFFTTDLDSLYLYGPAREASRNLIIASAFGLQPEAPKAKKPPTSSNGEDDSALRPVFRDSYQTALYHSVRKFIKGEADFDKVETGLWEVGRNNIYKLKLNSDKRLIWTGSNTPGGAGVALPELAFAASPEYRFALGFIAVAALISIGAFFFFQIREFRSRQGARTMSPLLTNLRPYFWIIGPILLAVAVAALVRLVFWLLKGDLEPSVMFDGVSVWPSILLRMLVVALGLFLFVRCALECFASKEALEKIAEENKTVEGQPEENQAAKIILDYTRGSVPAQTFVISLALGCLFTVIFPIVIGYLGPAAEGLMTPARGTTSFVWHEVSITLGVGILACLTGFSVIQHVRLKHCLQCLAELPQSAGKAAGKEQLLPQPVIDPISEHATDVAQSAIFPFVVLLLLLASRHAIFDGWNVPLVLLVTAGISLAILLACGISLSLTARRLRVTQTKINKGLKSSEAAARQGKAPGEVEAQQTEDCWNEVRGPFGSPLQQPLLQTLILIAAAFGLGALEPLLHLTGL